jgi:NADH-quinone oxidoreductase subunit F
MPERPRILVGMSTCNLAAGAQPVWDACRAWADAHPDAADLAPTGCFGMCHAEPQVRILANGADQLFSGMSADSMRALLDDLERGAEPGGRRATDVAQGPAGDFLSSQRRVVLERCGRINPDSIDDALAHGGYESLRRCLDSIPPDEVIETVRAAGLRGRGGAGFSTGMKWSFARRNPAPEKIVICNADEGDPGAFMDRSTLESDPHAVLEGMLIAGYATGAREGLIYCRAEYPLAVERLERAIGQMRERGLLGERILDSDFSFDLHVKEGAGAFVCGEETALIASVEGRRGMPRIRPPYPAEAGAFGRPTTINNVETLANIPWIIRHGPEAFRALGTESSAGTKVFALAGKARRGGLIEVPMGITIREIVEHIGGGPGKGHHVKAVQLGGPSGGCIPESMLDVRVDYEEVTKTGAIMGSGGMVVMDETTCMVDVARYFIQFTQNESCGKCTFCRIGTRRMLEILTRICEGRGEPEDLESLADLADKIKSTSLCGLGQTAPNPVLTTLRYFREELEEHIVDRFCRAGKCPDLCRYTILDNCTGCTACARVCPVDAIRGEKRKQHVIDPDLCIRCGACRVACRFEAIGVSPRSEP